MGHMAWARSVAWRVAREVGWDQVGAEQRADLEAEALLVLCERACAFDMSRVPPGGDPVAAFRGYAYVRIYRRVQQFALRLRNGGLFHTRRPTLLPPPAVESWSAVRGTIPGYERGLCPDSTE